MSEEQTTESQPTPSRDVFISYATHDKAVAAAVCKALEGAGLSCWIAPRDVVPGESFAGAIVHAIDATKVIVLVFSEHAADSQHVLREVERAASKRHAIVAFRLDMKPLPADFEYFLNTSQWLDASTTGVRRALPKLIEAVRGAKSHASAEFGRAPAPTVANVENRRSRAALIGSVGLVLATVAYLLINRFLISKTGTTQSLVTSARYATSAPVPKANDKSVAVLPFVDMSEKHDQEYFADGMAEEIIERLVKLPELRVPARASSFYFKGKHAKVADIARELTVANILEGTVRKSGNRLRISAQLVRAETGLPMWSETFDRQLADVFAIQDEIATATATALQITLSGGALAREEGGTRNLEAYQLYLRGMSGMNENSTVSVKESRARFEQAIRLDPNFGLAWSGLAFAWTAMTDQGYVPPREGYERSRQAGTRAAELSPRLAMAHVNLAYVYRTLDWNWSAAAEELERALAIRPGFTDALYVKGLLAQTLGRRSEADRWLRAAIASDPLSTFANFNYGNALYLAGRFAEADAQFRRLLQLAPRSEWTRSWLAKTLVAEGQPAAALAVLPPEQATDSDLIYLAVILLANGRKAEAEQAIQRLEREWGNVDAFNIASYYAYANDRARAVQWLERAVDQKDTGLVDILGEPLLKNIENEPRYKAVLRKMNLPGG